MKNKYGSETKTKKAFDSISVLQDKDKYHKNLISKLKIIQVVKRKLRQRQLLLRMLEI